MDGCFYLLFPIYGLTPVPSRRVDSPGSAGRTCAKALWFLPRSLWAARLALLQIDRRARLDLAETARRDGASETFGLTASPAESAIALCLARSGLQSSRPSQPREP